MTSWSAHETAIVEDGASIGADTRIWHHAHVRTGARIGSACTLGKNVFVDEGAVIGDRVKIQNNVSVYRGVSLEDEVFVGPSAVFTNDLFPRAVADTWEVVPTVVRRGASIGANATIICGTAVGSYAMIGAGTVVTSDVPAHALLVGNPARRLGWVCFCGEVLARTGDSPPATPCPRCGRRLRVGER